jgi:hypothetical protein
MPDRLFKERQWRNLLTDIHDGQVIAVIGPELTIGPDQSGETTTLFHHMARELVRRLDLDESHFPTAYNLLDVSNSYLQDPQNEVDDLHREVRDILRNLRWQVPEPLRQLASIRDLNLFVTTTFDSFMEDALNQARFGGAPRTQVLTYSEKAQMQDLPAEFDSAPQPTVFHLFGRFNASGDYALSEEKVLEYGHRMQSRDLRPPNLFDVLKARHLLMLGCSLPGWLARFTLRALKGDLLLTQGARGSVVADRTSWKDHEFAMFLERRRVSPYYEGDALQFIGELERQWQSNYGTANAAAAPAEESREVFKPDSVFLSYAREDLAVAMQVWQALDHAGVDVWFDKQRLEVGDSFRLEIEKNIENCSYFVPLISRHTAQMEKRFFQREWKKAIDEAPAWPEGHPFIQPLLIDDVEITAPGIPSAFRQYHALRLDELSAFVEAARLRIRERRFARRAG